MKLDDLLHELEAVSKVLKLPDLCKIKYPTMWILELKQKDTTRLLKRLSIQHDAFFDSKEEVEKILEEISELLNILSKHCDLKLSQLSFINNVKANYSNFNYCL